MGELNLESSTAPKRTVGDVAEENTESKALIKKTNEMQKAIAVADQFIAHPEQVYSNNGGYYLESWGSDPGIHCSGGKVSFISYAFSGPYYIYLTVKRDPYVKKDGWEQYNANVTSAEEVRQELVSKLSLICGAKLFAPSGVGGL